MRRVLAMGFLWLLAAASAHAIPWSTSCIQPLLIGQTLGGGQLTTSDCYWYAANPNEHYYTDVYSFVGTAGQQVSVALSSTAFDTFVELFNVNEISASSMAFDDNGGGGTNSRIPAGSGMFTLPATGTYYIWVESIATNATGTYTLALDGTASAYARTYVQKAYVSYYGRPADPAGLAYWAARMDAEGGSLNAIIAAFGYSDEFNRRYGGLDYTALVTKIYQQTLARNPDPAGLAYYVGELQAGRRILQSITLDVLNGATTAPDSTTVANKLEVADYYTAKVAAGCGYGSEQAGLDALTPVTHLPATVTAAKAATDSRCAAGGGADSDDSTMDDYGVAPAPPMSIVPERPMSGRNVKVTVTAPGALSIGIVVAGGGCGTLTGRSEPTSVAAADRHGGRQRLLRSDGDGHLYRRRDQDSCRELRSPGVEPRPATGDAGGRSLCAPAIPARLRPAEPRRPSPRSTARRGSSTAVRRPTRSGTPERSRSRRR